MKSCQVERAFRWACGVTVSVLLALDPARGADVFVVARQNVYNNYDLYSATKANLIMRPREITARKIRAVFLNPLLVDFLDLAKDYNEEWANVAVSRMSAVNTDQGQTTQVQEKWPMIRIAFIGQKTSAQPATK